MNAHAGSRHADRKGPRRRVWPRLPHRLPHRPPHRPTAVAGVEFLLHIRILLLLPVGGECSQCGVEQLAALRNGARCLSDLFTPRVRPAATLRTVLHVPTGAALTALLLATRIAFERTAAGRAFEHWTYGRLLAPLALLALQAAQGQSVVDVDISEIPDGTRDRKTGRPVPNRVAAAAASIAAPQRDKLPSSRTISALQVAARSCNAVRATSAA